MTEAWLAEIGVNLLCAKTIKIQIMSNNSRGMAIFLTDRQTHKYNIIAAVK